MKNTYHFLIILMLMLAHCVKLNAQWIVGTTDSGGTGNFGKIVKIPYGYDTIQTTYNMLGGLNGSKPRSLVKACDGFVYGIADGGLNNHGILFSFNPATNVFTKKLDLHNSNCWYPVGIVMGNNGKIYGATNNTPQAYIFEYNIANNTIVKRDSTSRYYFPYNINNMVVSAFTTPFVGINNKIYYGTPSADVFNQNNMPIGGGAKLVCLNLANNTLVKIDSTLPGEGVRSVTESADSNLYVEIIDCCAYNLTTRYKNGFQNSQPLAQNYFTSANQPPLFQAADGYMYTAFAGGMQCYSDISINKYNTGFDNILSSKVLSAPFTTGEYSAYCQIYKMPDGNIYFSTSEGHDFCGDDTFRVGHLNMYTNQFSQKNHSYLLNSMVYSGRDFLGKDITKTILPNQKCNLTKINQAPEFSISYRKNTWAVMSTPTMAIAGTYYLIATSNAGCVDTQKVVVKYGAKAMMVLRTESDTDEEVSAVFTYPNPANEIVYAEVYSELESRLIIQLTDLQGKVLETKVSDLTLGTNKISIPLSTYSKGLYFLRIIENDELRSVHKIIKE